MKKIICPLLNALFISTLFISTLPLSLLNAANDTSVTKKLSQLNAKWEDDYEDEREVIKIDSIDNTDLLAIPFDDSELEDEEEVNFLEQSNTFIIPPAKNK